jgi:pyrimidine-nucleoside phosphorylase
MVPQWIIEKKRDGQALTDAEIRGFIQGYTEGSIPDYQMAALAMAVYFRGMSGDEIAALTDAMLHSGRTVDTAAIPLPKADKHSTGGIGDKVSLILAPLVACCGVVVPMISGRGLGITGGTLDKLEAIPGYRTRLSLDEFRAVLAQCGCSIIGQTPELTPADRKLYALRDVTGTVPSIPLIAASIMSKKLAEGLDALVLDVKWGQGAFMKTVHTARELARTMVAIGRRMGKAVTAVITDMNQPLGRTAGNALEVAETVACLQGRGPADVMLVTFELGAHMLTLTGRAASHTEALALLQRQVASGGALKRFRQMVELHGGAVAALEDCAGLPAARLRAELPATRGGYVARADAGLIGRACMALGAGRAKVDDGVDPAVGVSGMAKIGERVEKGQALLVMHANDEARLAEAARLIAEAFEIADAPPRPPELVVEEVT